MPNAGNIFLALFGAVAIAGVLGFALSTVMKGPLVSAVSLTRTNTAESQMALAVRSVVMAATSAANKGDCDSDGIIEPWEWRDAGSLPKPVGGGLVPDGLVANAKDPWGSDYGYCVWDNGAVALDAACKSGSANARLAGSAMAVAPVYWGPVAGQPDGFNAAFYYTANPDVAAVYGTNVLPHYQCCGKGEGRPPFDPNYANSPNSALSVAIVSAGPDKKFTTTCRTFAAADVNGNGSLGDTGDLTMVSKAAVADDDMIFSYTYEEATGASGGLWKTTKSNNCDGLGVQRYNDTASGHCYWKGTGKNKFNGQAACQAEGGYLAVISSATEKNTIMSNFSFSQWAYLGGSDAAVDGEWRWEGGELTGVKFWQGEVAGVAVNGAYSNWASGEPNNDGGASCMIVHNTSNGWWDYVCTQSSFDYLCEKTIIAGGAASIEKNLEVTGNATFTETGLFAKIGSPLIAADCTGLGASFLNDTASGRCYYVSSDTKNWNDAQSACLANGAHLAVVNNVTEETKLHNLIGDTWVWFGANDVAVEGEWRWKTGDLNGQMFWNNGAVPGYYTNWFDVQPDDFQGNQDCGMMFGAAVVNGDFRRWDDNGCTTAVNYLCEKPPVTSTPLQIDSGLKLASATAMPTCNAANLGAMRLNGGLTAIEICDGAAWKEFGSPSSVYDGTKKISSAGANFGCAVKSDGTAWCFGNDNSGQLGNGSPSADQDSPSIVYDGSLWKTITAGSPTCGIKSDGTAWCWGNDAFGQLGNGSLITANQGAPSPVTGGGSWSQIEAGSTWACGVKNDGSGWCWGQDNNEQLGDGTGSINRDSPTAVTGAGPWISITPGVLHTCGLKAGGTAWCWGNDSNGALGNGSTITGTQADPFPVSDAGPWRFIVAGSASCGIKTDGTAWCWGQDVPNGQLGNGSALTLNQESPTQVTGGGTWLQISPGTTHTCGIKSDYTAWCWGSDSNGQLGNGSAITANQPDPYPVTLTGPWSYIEAGNNSTCGITKAGKAYCWGDDTQGRLGNGAVLTASQDSPSPLNSTGTWGSIMSPNFPLLAPNGSATAPSYSFKNASGSGLWFSGGNLKLKSNGAVDINANGQVNLSGTTSDFRFTTNGLKIGSDTGVCSSALVGTLRYNSTSKAIEFCQGGTWQNF